MTKKWPKKITSVEAGGGQRAPAVWSVAGAGGVEAGGGRPGLPGWRAAGAGGVEAGGRRPRLPGWRTAGTRPAMGPRLGGADRARRAAAPRARGEPRAEAVARRAYADGEPRA